MYNYPMINIFLGGTCANNNWREEFTAALVAAGIPAETIYNPVLPPGVPWTQADADREHENKAAAKFNLFYIADPKQEGNTFSAYSTCEAIMGVVRWPGWEDGRCAGSNWSLCSAGQGNAANCPGSAKALSRRGDFRQFNSGGSILE